MDPNLIKELLTCSICLDRFKQPKVLPCQHTFCLRPCLERLVVNTRICCPQCRADHTIPPNGVDGFPSNLTIVQLLDVPTQNKPSVSISCQFSGEEAQSILYSVSNFRGIDIAIRPTAPSIDSHSSQTTSSARLASNSTGISAENVSEQDSSIVPNYRSKERVKRCFGIKGSEPGYLNWPWEIAVTADDKIVVADSSNHRIQIFDASGNSVRTFGRHGGANGEFNDPRGVCVTTSGQIVVADRYNNRIQVFDNQGRFISAFGQEKLHRPWSVATKSDGSVFVTDNANSIKVFSLNGDFIRTFGESWLVSMDKEKYITISHENKVIVSETEKHRIGVFDESLQLVLEIGTEGDSHGQLKYPRGVACDRHGYIIIADHGNHRIQVFDKDGNFITSFGSYGSQPGQMDGQMDGQMAYPTGVAVLRNGDIVVSDNGNHRIQIF